MKYKVFEVDITAEGKWANKNDLGEKVFYESLNKGHLIWINNKFYAVVDVLHKAEEQLVKSVSIITVMEVNEEIPEFYKQYFK